MFKDNLKVYIPGTVQRIYLELLRELAVLLYHSWHGILNSPELSLLDQVKKLFNQFVSRQQLVNAGQKLGANQERLMEVIIC